MSMRQAVSVGSCKPQGEILGICKKCKAVCVRVDKRRELCRKCRGK